MKSVQKTKGKIRASDYGKAKSASSRKIAAPKLNYKPGKPRRYRPSIGMIGCGGITRHHLAAYRNMGYRVVAMADINPENAEHRRRDFYPEAMVYSDHRELLARGDIDVVDIATHPNVRARLVRDALMAGKHVLSQKPFVLNLAEGEKLAALAERQGVKLAVNQNGRWAPYFSYLRELVKAGYLGEISSVNMTLVWDHTWIKGTAFEKIYHVILYDFAIHWFDMVACLFGTREAQSVYAQEVFVPGQTIASPMSAAAIVRYEDGVASLGFHAHNRSANSERLTVTGTEGVFQAQGPTCAAHEIVVKTNRGWFEPQLTGHWFPDGMAGSMGELLLAIEENRDPENSATNNLRGLALCFAALQSARRDRAVVPGTARTAGTGCATE